MSTLDLAHLKAAKGWINTRSGKKFFPLAPDIALFDIYDQAGTLAHVARYGGQPRHFYPVALHAWIMSHVVEDRAHVAGKSDGYAAHLAKWALVHDNGEAYYGDVVRPLKMLEQFAFLEVLEREYERLLGDWLGLDGDAVPDEVHELDLEMCAYEAPLIYDKLHDDWKLPEQRAGEHERRFIVGSILRMINRPEEIRAEYLRRFDALFEGGADAYASR